MAISYLLESKEYYKKHWPGEDVAPIGASEEEIQDLERHLGFRLPEAHRELLLWMGKDYAGILSDESWYVDQIESMTRLLPGLLKENGFRQPEGKYVCLYTHQGYVKAWYLMPAESEDPEIYLYVEGDKEHPSPYLWGRFSKWVLVSLKTSHPDIWAQAEARVKYNVEQAALKGSTGGRP